MYTLQKLLDCVWFAIWVSKITQMVELDLLDTPLLPASIGDLRIFTSSLLWDASRAMIVLEFTMTSRRVALPWTLSITLLSRGSTIKACCTVEMEPLSRCWRYGMAGPLLRMEWTFAHICKWHSSMILWWSRRIRMFTISREICSTLGRGKYDLELTSF